MPDWREQHEAAQAFGPSPEKLAQLRNAGKLPWRRCGRQILVDAEALQKIQQERAKEYLAGSS